MKSKLFYKFEFIQFDLIVDEYRLSVTIRMHLLAFTFFYYSE